MYIYLRCRFELELLLILVPPMNPQGTVWSLSYGFEWMKMRVVV